MSGARSAAFTTLPRELPEQRPFPGEGFLPAILVVLMVSIHGFQSRSSSFLMQPGVHEVLIVATMLAAET